MSERGFEFLKDDDLEKLSYDELLKERTLVQEDRLQTKPYLHKITLLINGILLENDALRTLTPDTARALGMPEDKIALIVELQAKRKAAIKAGKGDVIIRHRKTLTMSANSGKHSVEGSN